LSAARLDRRTRGEPFDARAVKGAVSRPVIAGHSRDTDVAQLRMVEAYRRLAVHDQSNTNAGPDGYIGVVAQALGTTPAPFRQSRSNHVGGETQRYVEASREKADEIAVPPQLFWRGLNVAVGGRLAAQVDGTESSNADCAK